MKPTHFAIFGERCSGTNHAAAWIEKNTGLIQRNDFGWKHGAIDVAKMQKTPATLCVLVTRNLPDWLRSLHLKPHHLSPALRGVSFEIFVKRRVETIWDHQMGVSPRSRKFGSPIESEQHKGKPYANLLRLRLHKHRHWLRQMENLPLALQLRHEDLLDDPVPALHKVLAACGLPSRDDPVSVTSYKGREDGGDYQARRYAPISPEAMEKILDQVDWEMETRLGYDTRADLEAACYSNDPPDVEPLRAALANQPDLLARLESLETKLHIAEARLHHADLLASNMNRYLKSLFHAIERARPCFLPWWRTHPVEKPGEG